MRGKTGRQSRVYTKITIQFIVNFCFRHVEANDQSVEGIKNLNKKKAALKSRKNPEVCMMGLEKRILHSQKGVELVRVVPEGWLLVVAINGYSLKL